MKRGTPRTVPRVTRPGLAQFRIGSHRTPTDPSRLVSRPVVGFCLGSAPCAWRRTRPDPNRGFESQDCGDRDSLTFGPEEDWPLGSLDVPSPAGLQVGPRVARHGACTKDPSRTGMPRRDHPSSEPRRGARGARAIEGRAPKKPVDRTPEFESSSTPSSLYLEMMYTHLC